MGLAAMKHYMAAAHKRRNPNALLLDLGCGAGHDLTVLESFGLGAVGIDPSSFMVGVAAGRCQSPLVRAAGERLPFVERAFAGCWIERVLMHVSDPAILISEVVRCLQPGALLTIFEPDWSNIVINGSTVPAEWVTAAANPGIGSDVGGLLASARCTVLDRVEERSWWTYEDFVYITNLGRSLDRAVASGKVSRADADGWTAELHRQAARGNFRAQANKILWVATTPL